MSAGQWLIDGRWRDAADGATLPAFDHCARAIFAHAAIAAVADVDAAVTVAAAPDLARPFGGVKPSGWGRENGHDGIEGITGLKSWP